MISENTNLEVIAEIEFSRSDDPRQRVVELERSLDGSDLSVVQGFGDEFGYYLVQVGEGDEDPSDEVLGKAKPIITYSSDGGGGSWSPKDDDHPLDPSSYAEPSVDEGDGRTENTYGVTD